MSDVKKDPCLFVFRNERGKEELVKPVKKCDSNCRYCGFNPEEQKRRLEKGHFIRDGIAVILHYSDERDDKGTPLVYSGLKQLVFPPL